MTVGSYGEKFLIENIRKGDADAWQRLIDHFEGRLFAFFRSRVSDQSVAEDLVQETFVGLLLSLKHFNTERPLEQYLFSIAAHKLTDYLRKVRSRPDLQSGVTPDSQALSGLVGRERSASSLFQSRERRTWEEKALVNALRKVVSYYKARGYWEKLACIELLVLRGWPNKRVAEALGISEQAVANLKFEFLEKAREAVRASGLPADVLAELRQLHAK